MRAVCVRCGQGREVLASVCPGCGHVPLDEGLLVAWLLSDENLDEAALAATAERIKLGEVIRPSARMLDRARRALGQHLETDPGLSTQQRLGLLACSLLVTPLLGWVLWGWWRIPRPLAARQALALSAPASVIWFVGGVYLMFAGV